MTFPTWIEPKSLKASFLTREQHLFWADALRSDLENIKAISAKMLADLEATKVLEPQRVSFLLDYAEQVRLVLRKKMTGEYVRREREFLDAAKPIPAEIVKTALSHVEGRVTRALHILDNPECYAISQRPLYGVDPSVWTPILP